MMVGDHSGPWYLLTVLALVLLHLGCQSDDAAKGPVVAIGRTTGALTNAEHASVNGTYGVGCRDRQGDWSLGLALGAALDHDPLSVVRNDTTCELTLTALHITTNPVTPDPILASPAIVLGTSYGATASRFGAPLRFYADAMLDSVSFSGDFVLTVLSSDDPSVGSAVNTAFPMPPTVVDNTPPVDAVNVSIATRPTATFSTAMNAATLTPVTFTVKQGATSVAGTVSFNALTDTATFTPDAALALNSVYDVRVTTDAKDVRQTALAEDYFWSFTTAVESQGFVYLRSASSFVVLAGSTVTNTGESVLTGDLGLSPGTVITGFPPGEVVGTVSSADATAEQAKTDLTAAYDEVTARTVAGAVPISGNLGGQTLNPGLYTSLTSLGITGKLTLDALGEEDAVFLFRMGSTLTTASLSEVSLVNGAKSANVFWQVGSSATLATDSVFAGTILALTSITANAGATLNGRALAINGAVELEDVEIVRPTP